MADGLDLSQLDKLSGEEIQALLAAANQIKKDRKSGSDKEKEEKAKAELQPFEDRLGDAESKYKEFDEGLKEKEKNFKETLKKEREKALAKVQEIRDQRDAKRKELGLKVSRKKATGPQMSWNVDYELADKNAPKARVSDANNAEHSVVIEIEAGTGKVSTKAIKKDLFEKFNIPDPTGGRWRGLVNRVKNGYLAAISENGEGPKDVPANSATPAENPAQ